MYLQMTFGKNKEQTTRQLKFKFDPLPTESAEICLFHERWIKTFCTQPFCQLCIKYVLVFYKIDLVQFCNNYLGGPSQKNLFWALEKWKIDFSSKEKENFLRQYCLSFQYAPLCTIWDNLNELCHSKMHPCAKNTRETNRKTQLHKLEKVFDVLHMCYDCEL